MLYPNIPHASERFRAKEGLAVSVTVHELVEG